MERTFSNFLILDSVELEKDFRNEQYEPYRKGQEFDDFCNPDIEDCLKGPQL